MAIIKQKALWIPLGLTLALAAAGLALGLARVSGLGYPVILHFDQFHGVDLVGTASDFWGIWLGGLALVALNCFLSEILFRRERFLAYLFLAANVLLSILMLVFSAVVATAN